jgi:hypothetical protein
VIAPKFLGDASIVQKMKIVCCAGIGCCGGDGQGRFVDNELPEKTETKTALPVEQVDAGFEIPA